MLRRNRKVTPTSGHALTYDEESWKPTSDECKQKDEEEDENISRTIETRQSKTKRVKKFLKKKYRNALGSRSSSTEQTEICTSSWYIDKQVEDCLNRSEVNELEEVYEDAQVNLDLGNFTGSYRVANVVQVSLIEDDTEQSPASPLLAAAQEPVEEEIVENQGCKDEDVPKTERSEVALLVDRYFGSLYKNYEMSRKCLIRQARDLLVCEYHGCLQKFETEFCVETARLLQHVKDKHTVDESIPSTGWPLCLGPSSIIIHLGPLDVSLVRNRDCYLCVRNRTATGPELALIWRRNGCICSTTLAEIRHDAEPAMCSNLTTMLDVETTTYGVDDRVAIDLPELLQNLLVSVEHAIERVPLDELVLPCPQCGQHAPVDRKDELEAACVCQCACRSVETPVKKRDTSIQTSPMFEFDGSIPHIDSDEDEEKEPTNSSKRIEIAKPKSISDLPDKLLMSGINLPGTSDTDGKPIILCYAECIGRAGLNKYEIAKLLLYYSSIPVIESVGKGFTILLLAENESNNRVLELIDKSICLIANSMKFARILIWKPNSDDRNYKSLISRVQAIVIVEETDLWQYLNKDQAPASCGGDSNHDQLEWVEFYKQLEPFLNACNETGLCLLATLSQVRNEEIPHQITRRFLNHQCRQITKAFELDEVQKLRREGNKTLANLKERSQWLSSSKDVKRSVSIAYTSFNAIEKVTKRLEQLRQERTDRLKELARFRTLQDEAEELITWIHKVGEEKLENLISLLRTAGDTVCVKDLKNEFEKFYFNAWRQVEKSNDLIEECKKINDPKGQTLKDCANKLNNQMKIFNEKLDDARVRMDDCLRCFILLDSCPDILEDNGDEQQSFIQKAEKSKNDKLIQICKTAKCPTISEISQPPDRRERDKSLMCDLKELSATSTPIRSQLRRRSVSSYAYIYHCNHHAAGEPCTCCESDTENTVSYKLKKKYIQTLQSCACPSKDTIERKNSGATLVGIKEERESVEDLLEKIADSDCRRCDSGMSTAENSLGEDAGYERKSLKRTCSCRYYRESCALCSTSSSSAGSNQDHIENQQDSIIEEGSDGFVKSNSSDDIEEEHYSEERRKVPPITANSHLYFHTSTLDLPTDALYSNMDPKTQKTLKYIIKEMIETERDYVKSLDYIIENYIPELMREDIPQALRGQRNIVFGNVEKIYEFHNQHFLSQLEQCENNPLQVGQIFLKHDKKFYLYALYNKNKPKSDALMSEYGSLFFKSKQIELKDKMDLASYLLKPVQRMGKYALLLQQMMKACSNYPAERPIPEIENLKLAEEMVRFKLRHGNDLLAMDSIRECDVNLKEQGKLLRQNEFLVWEGRKKSLRQVFLFEELILFSKARRFPDRKNLDLYIYKNSIKMTDIGLTAKIGDSPTKFEIWFRKRKPNDTFILQSMSEDVKKAWTEELSQLLWKQAIKNRAVRMAEMSSMGIGNKPCLDIRPSADQINDRSISVDQLSRTAPRFRNSIVGVVNEICRNTKRPHSVISMSSVSSGSTSSGSSGSVHHVVQSNSMSLSYECTSDSPRPYLRSATLNSQCSMESGIIADMSLGSDECSEQTHGF